MGCDGPSPPPLIKNMKELNSIGQSLDISDLELSDEFQKINIDLAKHPGKFGKIVDYLSEVRIKIAYTERELKEKLAEVEVKIRNDMEASSKKVTEKHIEKLVTLDPNIQVLEHKLLDLQKDELILGLMREAYIHRKDCLLDLARNLRAQYFNSSQLNA